MKTLASRIQGQLQVGEWRHCAVYEHELKHLWPSNEKDRKAKIEQFVKEYGFRLAFYKPGLCAIFEKGPNGNDPAPMSSTRIQDRKHGGYRIRSTLDRIEIGLATAHRWQMMAKRRWQMISKPPAVLLQRVACQTKMALSHCYTWLESFLKAKWHIFRPPAPPTVSTHVYEIRPRGDKHGVDLISDALPFGPLWYAGPNAVSNAIGYAKFRSRSHDAVICVYDEAGNVIETAKRKRFRKAT